MKLNEKAQQIIEYLLIIGAVVGGVLAAASLFKTAVEQSLNKAVETIYGGYTWRTSGVTCTALSSGATCGLGTATRSVWCESDNTGQVVGDAFCANVGAKPQESNIPCDLGACGNAYWDLGAWGSCSVACGGGTQNRSVVCRDGGGATLPDSSCPQPPPIGSRPCNSTPCHSWKTGNACITLCSAACGSGNCDQSVTCVNNLTGLVVAET